MAKEAVFSVKLEPDLRDAFVAEAAAMHLPASHLVREYMRDLVRRRREEREYDEWYRRKVEAGLADALAGRGRTHEEVAADAAAWRAELLQRLNDANK